ncbi:MAG: AAA family ATPase, partial [Candidatus Limnocylindrales bacterium]
MAWDPGAARSGRGRAPRRVVIVVDETHLLTPEQLEELRLLTDSDIDSRSPFAGILLGQPSLARQLRLGVFAA